MPGLRRLLSAIVVGVACFIVSVGCARLAALAADVPYRSKVGFTFMWRLKFLQQLSPEERGRAMDAAAARAESAETRAIIAALRENFDQGEPVEFAELIRAQRDVLFPPGSHNAAARTDDALNGLPAAFALGSPATLVRAVATDFSRARETTIADVTEFLFWSTAYYFGREAAMPEFGKLVTFRGRTGEEVIAMARQHSYLQWWRGISHNGWQLVWLLAFTALLALGYRRRVVPIATCSYATALALTALLLMLLNCCFTELLARYTLPMFELTLLSLAIVVSGITETFAAEPPPSRT